MLPRRAFALPAPSAASLTSNPATASALPAWTPAACLAVVLPTLLAFNLPPSATFLNQAVAFIGWGVLVFVVAAAPGVAVDRPWRGPERGLLAALALLALAAGAAPLWAALPWTLALSALGTLAAAALVVVAGAALARSGLTVPAFHAIALALLATGVIGTGIGVVQVFIPQWADGTWIASIANGRAAGNLRQPNHLSSLLLWALIALVWLVERGRVARAAGLGFGLLLTAGVVLTSSRTGMLGVLMLAAWGALDRQLARPTRIALIVAPLVFAALWAGLGAWAHSTAHPFGGETQLTKEDLSSSRFGIWANTLALIARHPWLGVGWGEFNFAWSLTPFPGRPVAFFDHTHNIVLQFLVELGVPLGLLVLALLGRALWRAWRAGVQGEDRDRASALRAAFLIVLTMAVHSQFEYPLWYAYFLLPTAFAFGLCVDGIAGAGIAARPSARRSNGLRLAAALLFVGTVAALVDYGRVVVIFAPGSSAAPLAERIADGKRSWLFGHHADYAAVTTAEHVGDPRQAFARVPHYLLDTRLMMAWARSLEEDGQHDAARHVAQRLREFRSESSQAFFEVCDLLEDEDAAAAPFQCQAPAAAVDYRTLR